MELKASREIRSSVEERLLIDIRWNPTDPKVDGLVALIATVVDLVDKYIFLDKVVNEPNR
jgi:hypothetical protein